MKRAMFCNSSGTGLSVSRREFVFCRVLRAEVSRKLTKVIIVGLSQNEYPEDLLTEPYQQVRLWDLHLRIMIEIGGKSRDLADRMSRPA
jgi:hypothetical protein